MGQGTEKRYWIAHVRGPFYDKLRQCGFLVLYPAMDDYVFLEVCDKHKPLLNRQTELCISFLKKKERLVTASQAEVERMCQGTTEHVQEGVEIEVISGYCAGLDGRILTIENDQCHCELQGYNRTYRVLVDKLDIVFKKGEESELRL